MHPRLHFSGGWRSPAAWRIDFKAYRWTEFLAFSAKLHHLAGLKNSATRDSAAVDEGSVRTDKVFDGKTRGACRIPNDSGVPSAGQIIVIGVEAHRGGIRVSS
jgi:hypothetical protein